MSGDLHDQKMQSAMADVNMQDSEPLREGRVPIGQLNMNRKQRRKFAKKYGLFGDHSGEAWRIGNKHMKGDKQNKETEHKLGQ